MKKEDEKLKRLLSENPFSVPENYFEELTGNVMARLPGKESVPVRSRRQVLWTVMRPWVYVAALIVAVLLPLRYWTGQTVDKIAFSETVESGLLTDEYIKTVIDDSMMDDYTLYQYLTDAEIDY